MLTARTFAKEKGISYTTVMAWLKEGLIPDAELEETPAGVVWQIPPASLNKVSERKRGPKKVATVSTVTAAETKPPHAKPKKTAAGKSAAAETQPARKRVAKKTSKPTAKH